MFRWHLGLQCWGAPRVSLEAQEEPPLLLALPPPLLLLLLLLLRPLLMFWTWLGWWHRQELL